MTAVQRRVGRFPDLDTYTQVDDVTQVVYDSGRGDFAKRAAGLGLRFARETTKDGYKVSGKSTIVATDAGTAQKVVKLFKGEGVEVKPLISHTVPPHRTAWHDMFDSGSESSHGGSCCSEVRNLADHAWAIVGPTDGRSGRPRR